MMRLNPFKKASTPATPKQPKAPAAPFIEDGKLAAIAEALTEIGLLEAKAFKSAVTSDSFYFGGSLEWSERTSDMRFIVEGWAGGRVTRIYATPLKGAKNFLYGEELIASVNRRVQELLNP